MGSSAPSATLTVTSLILAMDSIAASTSAALMPKPIVTLSVGNVGVVKSVALPFSAAPLS